MRVGVGYDSHRFTQGRKLILGGVEIPHPQGLAGHSDADVVAHALTDAVLGAAGLGDIGALFPDTDPQWQNASSIYLLNQAYLQVLELRLHFVNADITVIAEQPPPCTVWRAATAGRCSAGRSGASSSPSRCWRTWSASTTATGPTGSS